MKPPRLRRLRYTSYEGHADCGPAALAVLSGRTYEACCRALWRTDPAWVRCRGTTWHQMRAALAFMGLRLHPTTIFARDVHRSLWRFVSRHPRLPGRFLVGCDDHWLAWSGSRIGDNNEPRSIRALLYVAMYISIRGRIWGAYRVSDL